MAGDKTNVTTPMIPVGWGEVFDKITILEIKERKITDPNALRNVRTELEALRSVAGQLCARVEEVAGLMKQLSDINVALWDVEDRLREFEVKRQFNSEFIENARRVYILNDQRARLKRSISVTLGSAVLEEKLY